MTVAETPSRLAGLEGELAGKVVLITGARQGIGAATAMEFARRGARVIASGRREGDCAGVVAAITAAGGSAHDHGLDVAALGTVKARIEAAAALFGRLDIVVNNASRIEPMAPVAGLDPLAFDETMRINVSGPAAVIGAAWPYVAGGGRIVNLLSGAAARPLVGWGAYCTSKAALLMLTRATDLEGAEQGIRCFGFAPGLVDTAMQGRIRAARVNEISDLPQASLVAPAAAGALIVWLASGRGDAYAGTLCDLRDPALRAAAAA